MPADTALKAAEVNAALASTGTAGLVTADVFRSHAAVFCKGNRASCLQAGAAQLHQQSVLPQPLLFPRQPSPTASGAPQIPSLMARPLRTPASRTVRVGFGHVNFGEGRGGGGSYHEKYHKAKG